MYEEKYFISVGSNVVNVTLYGVCYYFHFSGDVFVMSKDISMKYTADIAAVKVALERSMQQTEEAMKQVEEVKKDTADAKTGVEELERQSKVTGRNVMQIMRRGVALLHLFLGSSRNAVVQSMNILAQATLITAQTIFEIATAEAITVLGTLNAVLGFSAVISLFAQAQTIYMFGRQAETRFDDIDRSIRAANIVFAGW